MTDRTNKKEEIIQGVAASPGVAHGEVFVIHQRDLEIPVLELESTFIPREIERFERTLVETRKEIMRVRNEVAERLGEGEAKIFDAHLLVLEDTALIDETIRQVQDTHYNVEHCYAEVAQRYIEVFAALDDEYIKERMTDIRDVTRRVLQNLLGQSAQNLYELTSERVVASEDVSPSDAAQLEGSKVIAVVTDAGSRTSHAVIMARSLKIPAVVGLHDITKRLASGDYVLVDGYDGTVIINPGEETLFRYGRLKQERLNIQKTFEKSSLMPAKTQDGVTFKVCGNIGGPEECAAVLSNGGEGVGLYRTESLFIGADKFPTEEEQYQAYRRTVETIQPHPIVIRTLDLGGDKMVSSLNYTQDEENPFMGFRAIRFCLEHTDIFKDQLRAILRASAFGDVSIMYPMISSVEELIQANRVLEEAKEELRHRHTAFDENVRVGSMIEIPGAALVADLLAEHCDFFSVGTNDLIQYLLAVDRVNDRIAHLYQPNHPAVIRTLSQLMTVARKKNIPVGVCGEMAADPIYVPLLFGLGADTISVAPTSLPEIKYLLRRMNFKEAQELAKKVAGLTDPEAIFMALSAFYAQNMGDLFKDEE
ncbi:MAG: phosphoenolpyruvate--protein phosphotransferase [Puniceicoccales bacterium]